MAIVLSVCPCNSDPFLFEAKETLRHLNDRKCVLFQAGCSCGVKEMQRKNTKVVLQCSIVTAVTTVSFHLRAAPPQIEKYKSIFYCPRSHWIHAKHFIFMCFCYSRLSLRSPDMRRVDI